MFSVPPDRLDPVHREAFVVRSFDLDWNERVSVRALTGYLQEAARVHAEQLGYGLTWLIERGLAWALHRMRVEWDAEPRLGESIVVETWASDHDRLNAYRDFEVTGEGGRPLGRATSAWVVFDALQRRAVKLPQEWIGAGIPLAERPRAVTFTKRKLIGVTAATTVRPFRVRLGDLDVNGHTNNARYVEWAIESVPSDLWGKHRLAALDIVFRAESLYDDECTAESQRLEPGLFAHQIVRARDGVELARAETTWAVATSMPPGPIAAYLRAL